MVDAVIPLSFMAMESCLDICVFVCLSVGRSICLTVGLHVLLFIGLSFLYFFSFLPAFLLKNRISTGKKELNRRRRLLLLV